MAKKLRLDERRPDIDERFKEVVRGLVMVVNGLAPLRNKLSDGHARARKPAEHHARAVVNAAKTVAVFLVDSYRFQASSGLLGNSQPREGRRDHALGCESFKAVNVTRFSPGWQGGTRRCRSNGFVATLLADKLVIID